MHVTAAFLCSACRYNLVNGVYACENKETLKTMLKGYYNFSGFIVRVAPVVCPPAESRLSSYAPTSILGARRSATGEPATQLRTRSTMAWTSKCHTQSI